MNIVNVGYKSTNYYVLEIKNGRLLFDCGWPGSMPQFRAELKRKGLTPAEIKCVIVSHFHTDHAGLVQDLKNLGANFVLLESQINFIKPLNDFHKRKKINFTEISEAGNYILNFEDSRRFLASIGLNGEIISTPGHTDDSITLILDDGLAFIGDLHLPQMIPEDEFDSTQESWNRIREHKAHRIYPAHGNHFSLEEK